MQFATLFLIASAVLAMPTGDRSDNTAQLAKKDTAPAGGFRFPTDEEDNSSSSNFIFPTDDEDNSSSSNFLFPTDDEDNSSSSSSSSNFRFPTHDEETPQNTKPQQNQPAQQNNNQNNQEVKKDRYKDQKANNGKPCWDYMDYDLVDIPVECMKPIFCNYNWPRYLNLCPKSKVDIDNWTKDDLINIVKSTNCVGEAICRREDYYNTPPGW